MTEQASEVPRSQTLYVRAYWEDWNAWQSILVSAARQRDDASEKRWWSDKFALPLVVEARNLDNEVQWRTRTDAVRALEAPINRPRCELQAAYRALGAILRLGGGTGNRSWKRIILDIVGSNYVSFNATLPRLQRWYKNGYHDIANRSLWEQIRMALTRLHQNDIACEWLLHKDENQSKGDIGDGSSPSNEKP